jgi:hypothetical protein
VTGGGRVHYRQVVHGTLGAALELRQVPDLAHGHELGEPRGRRRQVLEHAAAAEQAGERVRAQLVAEPLLLGALRVHGHPGQAGGQLLLAVGGAGLPEHRREPLLRRDLAHDHPLPAPCRGQSEGGRDRGLADPALARNDHQTLVQQ